MKKIIATLISVFVFSLSENILSANSIDPFPPANDVQDIRSNAYAFTNAVIHTDYQTKLDQATLLILDGKVIAVGKKVSIPEGYLVIDVKGRSIYPGLIDIYTEYGLSNNESVRRPYNGRGDSPKAGVYYPNDAIKSHYNAIDKFTVNPGQAATLRKLGFGSVLALKQDGIARGSSALVSLADDKNHKLIIKSKAAAHYSFNNGDSGDFPSSPMGAVALLRQTYLDAEWYANSNQDAYVDQSLEAWLNLQKLPQIFETGHWTELLKADEIGDEFGIQYIIKGRGDEYRRINEIKATKAKLIIPLNFPDAYDVDDPIDAKKINLADMKHWELAPTNLAVLAKNKITFAITSKGQQENFWKNIRKAIKYGLSKEDALKALTSTPAEILGVKNQLGLLKSGAIANFLIVSGDLFDEEVRIHENWVQGQRHELVPETEDYEGIYNLRIGTKLKLELKVSGKKFPSATLFAVSEKSVDRDNPIDAEVKLSDEAVSLSFDQGDGQYIRLSGWINDKIWQGRGQLSDGTWIDWQADYIKAIDSHPSKPSDDQPSKSSDGKLAEKPPQTKDTDKILGNVIYPFSAFGQTKIPQAETILVRNATVWTNEKEGILKNTDVLIKKGKIARIGKKLPAGKARIIDGSGKHLTPGIIDEHSHIALNGVNEIAVNSSMVRMSDVINSEDINIYRNLAGGVVAAQLLHGSANPIGGQSAMIKMRWGKTPNEMLIKNAPKFIKFALGENVKQSSGGRGRYPSSRMGVEQVYVDAFTQARDYEKQWKTWNKLSRSKKKNTPKPRRDLAMDATLEILNRERFITCHSYVQSEINMLMEVAERFGFRINTFTHILEGYKLADKMAKHGVGGSSFADWWAYKWEVRYAIPYNVSLMEQAGVVSAINSDDAEMSRRLNQEAAKSIKYGNMSEENALKLITLNPAKLLRLDDRMGSIRKGKDADLVLWSNNPMSVYARAEKTLVDGRVYFDIEKDQLARKELEKERARLIQKLQLAKQAGEPTQKAVSRPSRHWHCDSINGYEYLNKEHHHE